MFDKCAKINYVNVIYYSLDGNFQSNSCTKINITDITLYFQLQNNIRENIFKSTIPGNIFINS
jgi:hypothetical protein